MRTILSMNMARLVIAGLSVSGLAFSQDTQVEPLSPSAHPYFKQVPRGFIRFAADQPEGSPPAAGLPTFTSSFTYKSKTYSYTMLGANPSTGASTTLPVVFVPLIFKVGTSTFDPTQPVSGSTLNEIQVLEQSPLFTPVDLLAGGVDLGVNQYEDNFMRANFWTATGAGTNGYHLMLSQPTVKSPITLTVPKRDGKVAKASGGNLGEINLTWFQNQINSILSNNAIGVNANEFVIFVSYDIVFYEGVSADCCVIGFHSQDGSLTYGVASYTDPGDFSTILDIEVATHEIGEAIDDPTTVNSVPAWGNVGQVTGCQSNLEVGDPVTGTYTTITGANGFVYHPEDLVFVNWFSRTSPSPSVNGWYTLLDTFKGDAKACPPGGTN